VAITGVQLSGTGSNVFLTTDLQLDGTNYMLLVSNITDMYVQTMWSVNGGFGLYSRTEVVR